MAFQGVMVRNCHLVGFWNPIYLKDAPGAVVEANTIVGDPYGSLYAAGGSDLKVQGNKFIGPGANCLIAYAPRTVVRDNHFDPASSDPYEFISVSIYGSPRSSFTGNESAGRTYVSFSNHSDGSLASDNHLVGGSRIAIGHSSDGLITRNQLGPVSPAELHADSAVSLYGASGNEISLNVIEGHRLSGIYVVGDLYPTIGSDSNVIRANTIHDANIGITIYSGSGNRVVENELRQTWLGIELLSNPHDTKMGGNIFERNTVAGGEYGVFAAYTGENLFSENTFSEQVWGIFEFQSDSSDREPNVYKDNTIEASKLFGVLAWGTSPRLLANRFLNNGEYSYVPIDPTDVMVLSLLGDLRGGMAFLPYAGDSEVTTLDDGDPNTDVLSAPLIGNADQPNHFSNNMDVDIYALDCRAENQSSLEHDNWFEARTPPEAGAAQRRPPARVRQDWFGLVRVEDTYGAGVEGATVEIRDARGQAAGLLTSGPTGFAPADDDPNRTQGHFEGEPGGPIPAWPRFTQFVVGESGQREDLTPHRLMVSSPTGVGRSRYSWDGVDNDTLVFRIVDGRYQTALVVLDMRHPR